MTLINFYCIGFPSFVLALEPNTARVRGNFLANVLKRALPASAGVLAGMTLINFYCIGFPSFVLALEPNTARVRGNFLANVLKRALPASAGVLAGSILCMGAAALFGYSEAMLSTMCLITACAVGVYLIWRISVPFTPLRRAVFVFVVAGLAVGVIRFPGFFSIARLKLIPALLGVLFAAVGCLLFAWLTDLLERSPEKTSKLATGFGRGVRVSVRGRSGGRKVVAFG